METANEGINCSLTDGLTGPSLPGIVILQTLMYKLNQLVEGAEFAAIDRYSTAYLGIGPFSKLRSDVVDYNCVLLTVIPRVGEKEGEQLVFTER